MFDMTKNRVVFGKYAGCKIEFKNGESSTVFLDKEYIDVLNKSGIKVDIAVT